MSLVNKQKVQDILVGMFQRSTASDRFSALRELIARLNYEPAHVPLKADLPQCADPDDRPQAVTLLGLGGTDSAFHIIHAYYSTSALSRVAERAVISRLLQAHPYALFVFSNSDHTLWHFVNVRVAKPEATDENRDAKLRRLYRRITVGPMEQLRTATERIELLDLEHIAGAAGDLFGLSPLAIQLQHEVAFDVEAVTDQFFKLYKEIFETVMKSITGLRGKELRTYFTQRLFNRLMFIAFIQKKGWLRFASEAAGLPDPSPADYLYTLWADYEARRKDDGNFYNDRLRRLFFHALNTSNETNQTGIRGTGPNKTLLQRVIGEVPYLNGGLFECDPDGTDEDVGIVVPDKAIKSILHDLFQRFNFTVTESTPLDVEVAVDPEMLGKVFEELVTGRHETGAYYTPKPIVSFMGREALKGYLQTKLPKESADAIAAFVDDHKAAGLKDPERVLEALKKVTICDPACGSGAYLLGMLHELLDLRACLFASVKLDAPDVYDRKLEIIQNNLYGVDIEQFAINIARLRLWLSLAVDFNGDVTQLPPLPNLDFKIERGDSVCGPDPSGGLQLGLHQAAMLSDFLDMKAAYLKAHHEEKKRLWKGVQKIREQLKEAAADGDVTGFFWAVEFAEVFANHGFDIVVANPPYVRQELIKTHKAALQKIYPEMYSGAADLCCYFFARAIQLLQPGGSMVFISSNKWMRAGYGQRLRAHLMRNVTPTCIVDFGHSPIFPKADTFPCIPIFTRRHQPREGNAKPQLSETFSACVFPREDYRADIEVGPYIARHSRPIPLAYLRDEAWTLEDPAIQRLMDRIRNTGVPLKGYCKSAPFYGIKSGFNEAFYIDAATRKHLIEEDERSKDIIRPLVRGRDVNRWCIRPIDTHIILTRRGTKINNYPAIKRHLAKFRKELEKRAGDQEWYELQASPSDEFVDTMLKPKIVYQEIQFHSWFSLETQGACINNKVFMLPTDDLALLGILCSPLMWWFLTRTLPHMKDEALSPAGFIMEGIPIATGTKEQADQIRKIVKRLITIAESLQAGSRSAQLLQDQLQLEEALATVVEDAYGLTAEERTLLRSTRPVRDPIDVLRSKIAGGQQSEIDERVAALDG